MLKLRIDRCIKSYYFLISSITLNSIWSSLSSSTLYCLIVNLYAYQIKLEALSCLLLLCIWFNWGTPRASGRTWYGKGVEKVLTIQHFFLKKPNIKRYHGEVTPRSLDFSSTNSFQLQPNTELKLYNNIIIFNLCSRFLQIYSMEYVGWFAHFS